MGRLQTPETERADVDLRVSPRTPGGPRATHGSLPDRSSSRVDPSVYVGPPDPTGPGCFGPLVSTPAETARQRSDTKDVSTEHVGGLSGGSRGTPVVVPDDNVGFGEADPLLPRTSRKSLSCSGVVDAATEDGDCPEDRGYRRPQSAPAPRPGVNRRRAPGTESPVLSKFQVPIEFNLKSLCFRIL